jgi:hypothetical protein
MARRFPACLFTKIASAMADPRKTSTATANEFFIQGITGDGRTFRPSDWAERLCGVLSHFRPEGSGGRDAHLKYSPYVRPTLLNGIKAVVVNEQLREIEPLAYHFVLEFARDNDLQTVAACLLPDADSRDTRP